MITVFFLIRGEKATYQFASKGTLADAIRALNKISETSARTIDLRKYYQCYQNRQIVLNSNYGMFLVSFC